MSYVEKLVISIDREVATSIEIVSLVMRKNPS